MRTHATGGKIFKITSDVVAFSTQFGMALACPIAVAHMEEHCKKVGATPGPWDWDADEVGIYSERLVPRPAAQRNLDDADSGVWG
jgi:hypothetical protein